MKRIPYLFLILIIALGTAVRFYRFNFPLADWHSWRQTDTSAVSQIFVDEGFDILHPKYYDISNIQTGKDNPNGYRYVEFPIFNILQAFFFKTLNLLPLEQWGRLLSIVSSVTTGILLFFLASKHFGKLAGIFTTFFYMFLPYSVYYGRVVLPDTMMVTAMIAGIYFFDLYISSKNKSKYLFLFVSTVFTAASFLLKPYALFFVLPQVTLAISALRFRVFLRWELWLHAILSVIPLIWWRNYMLSYPEGIPVYQWLFNGGNIRFTGAYFFWIFGERLAKLILGYFGVVFLILGVFKLRSKDSLLFILSFVVSSMLYLMVIARGNVQHDYYQILILPTIALLMGRGVSFIHSTSDAVNRKIAIIVTASVVVLSISLSWYYVRDYFNINNNSLVIAGKKADTILPKNAKVIAPYDGDTTLLYHIRRQGWPAFQSSIEEMQKIGATHLVIVNPSVNDFNGFGKQFKILAQDNAYLILEL